MLEPWKTLTERATQLASNPETSEMLDFYANLLRAQGEIYRHIRSVSSRVPSGDLEHDLPALLSQLRLIFRVAESGPATLADKARLLAGTGEAEISRQLIEYWHAPDDTQFFAKALLQPYGRCLADLGIGPKNRLLRAHHCPFCGGKPQVSFLKTHGESGEGGSRNLLCSCCLTDWPSHRVLCVHCGEEDPKKLCYFHTSEWQHVRIEACDSCKRYLKGIDLTILGLAVPLIDEVAAAPLDLWARELGYTKIELNLIGL
jgi:FdhE protein